MLRVPFDGAANPAQLAPNPGIEIAEDVRLQAPGEEPQQDVPAFFDRGRAAVTAVPFGFERREGHRLEPGEVGLEPRRRVARDVARDHARLR
jgi:hypothetical protein